MLQDFQVFQCAKRLHWLSRELQLSRYLRDQLLRASSSVALNVAEGSGKQTNAEQRRYYAIALGSLRECEAIVELERIEEPEIRDLVDRLGAMLFTLCRERENRDRTATINGNDKP